MMKKTTVIFDMDGLLFDSEKMYMKELLEFFNQNNICITKDMCKKVIGVDNNKFYQIVYQWWKYDTPFNEFVDILKSYYSHIYRDYKSILKPHVRELLIYLRNHGYKIALASSSPKTLIMQALNSVDLEQYFDLITSGSQFKESKPDPEIYLYTMNQLNSLKDETLIVEDSYYGIQAAINANVEVIALKDEILNLDQSHATHIINDLVEVIKYLK